MNPSLRCRFSTRLLPVSVLLIGGTVLIPQNNGIAACSSCGVSSAAAGSTGSAVSKAFPTLRQQFGGSGVRRFSRLTHTGGRVVDLTYQGQTTRLNGNETRFAAEPLGGEAQPLPGEPDTATSNTVAEASPPENGSTEAKGDTCPAPSGTPPTMPDQKTNVPDGAPGAGSNSGSNGSDGTGSSTSPTLPGSSTPQAPGDPSPMANSSDPADAAGCATETGPGGATATVASGMVTGVTDVAPALIVAVSLGTTSTKTSSGYLVPNQTRAAGVGPEQIAYYGGRSFDGVDYFDGISSTSPHTNDLRWHSYDGLTVLSKVTDTKLRFDFYTPESFDIGYGYPLHSGAVPIRSTIIEKLTGTSPDTTKPYTVGYLVRTAVTGRPVKLETMWSSGVIDGVSNKKMYSRVERSLENISGSTLSESVSTRANDSIERTIDLTVTEKVQQPVNGTETPTTKTIVARSQEKRRMFIWGEEAIESTTFLDATGTASRTTYTDFYDVPATDPNYARARLRRDPDGRWEAWFALPPDSTGLYRTGSVRGWKDTAAPVSVTTPADLMDLADNAGYTGTIQWTHPKKRTERTQEYANGYIVAKTEDLTPDHTTWRQQFRRTMKRYASAGTWFITVSTCYRDGRPKDVFEFKANTSPPTPTIVNTETGETSEPIPPIGNLIHWLHASDSYSSGITITADDAAHLPCTGSEVHVDPVTGELTSSKRLLITAVGSDGSASTYTTLSTDEWVYTDGRITERKRDDATLETWTYPSEFRVDHRDESGVLRISEYEPQGRLIRESISTVPSLTLTDMPGNPVLPAQNYYNVTEWLYGPSTATDGVTSTVLGVASTTRRLTAKTSITAAVPSAGGYRREWVEQVDGAGRLISSLDPLGTTKNTAYTLASGSGLEISTTIPGYTPKLRKENFFLSGQKKSTVFESLSTLLGKAGNDEYYDYLSSSYSMTRRMAHNGIYTSVNGYVGTTTDGIGRITGLNTPTGMTGAALYVAGESRSYDSESRLISRYLPPASSAGYYEMFDFSGTNGSSTRVTKRALSTDSAFTSSINAPTSTPLDASYNTSQQSYEQLNGFWGSATKNWFGEGTSGNPGSSRFTALGGFKDSSETTALGTWQLTGDSTVSSGGALVRECSYRLPGTALTRTRRYVDGTLRLTVVSYNGLAVLYDTNGTTYSNKLASYSVLRELQSEVSATSGYWPQTYYLSSTGLPYYKLTAGGSTKAYLDFYTGNDPRAGKLKSSYSYIDWVYTYFDYNARGQLIRQWGAGASPSQAEYDDLGRMTKLSTWRTGTWTNATWPASPPAADVTEWGYSPWLPLQISKKYADAGSQPDARRTVTYTYNPNGSLNSRTWQRLPGDASLTATGTGVVTSWAYDSWGRLQTIDYPAASTTVAATPDVTFSYNNAGQVSSRTDSGQSSTSYQYQPWGAPWYEYVASTNTANLPISKVQRTYDTQNRPDLLKVTGGGLTAPDVDYNFSGTTGLLDNVASDGRTITYGYSSSLTTTPSSLTYADAGSTLLSTSRPLNTDGLVSGITHNQPSPATVFQSLTYTYSVDRVTKVTRGDEDSMTWNYRYDSRGQLTSADKKFSSGEFAAGLQTEYTYDMAGNRITKGQGGDGGTTEGTNLRMTSYGAANALNQYSSITHPVSTTGSIVTWLDVTGRRSVSTENIQVNGNTADYQLGSTGLHFRKELSFPTSARSFRSPLPPAGGTKVSMSPVPSLQQEPFTLRMACSISRRPPRA